MSTYKNGELSLYINGEEKRKITFETGFDIRNLFISSIIKPSSFLGSAVTRYNLDGVIDEFKIYAKGLNKDEVLELYNEFSPGQFKRGDANGDNLVDISDAIVILNYLFRGSTTIGCQDAADFDDDGSLLITDAISLLDYLFKGEAAPPAPFPESGTDPTEDSLNC